MDSAEKEFLAIKQRNRKVELDKAWELSWTRRLFISALTYIIALIWLLMNHESSAAYKAFVPTAGYVLSTLSLRFVKNFWIKEQKNLK